MVLCISLICFYKCKVIMFYLNYSVVNVCFLIFWYMLFTLIVILAISAHQFVSLDTDLAKHLSQKTISNKPVYIIKASAVSSKRKMPWASIILSLVALYLTVGFTIQTHSISFIYNRVINGFYLCIIWNIVACSCQLFLCFMIYFIIIY